MTLTIEQIVEIIKENPNKEIMDLAKARNKRLATHMFGVGMDEYMKTINSFENEQQYAARKLYARSNRDIMERIARPIDKVFSAKGGSTFYNLPDNKNQEFRARLQNTENGLTLRKWIEQYWKPAYLSDPMGIVFMEIDENGDAYPTYKSIDRVFTYQPNGRRLDYVIFLTEDDEYEQYAEKNAKLYRVVDDTYDMLVKWDGSVVEIIRDQTYPNHFGYVPAIINSDIPVLASKSGDEFFDSPLWSIIEIADEYLRECSVKSVYKLLHGFPKYWGYGKICPQCGGTKIDSVTRENCRACNGTGMEAKKWDVADSLILPWPDTGSGDAIIAPNVAGYIAPPLDTWEKMSSELDELESAMFKTLWGTKQAEQADNNTATGRFIDAQPVNDRLSKFSDAAEVIEKFITDCMGGLYYGGIYQGSSINYGRRFTIESHDTIWDKYESARKNGAPDSILDDLLREYIQAKYENNSLELQRQLKAIELEPFPHQTAEQVQSLNVPPSDYMKKVYYSDFIKTLSENEVIFVNTDVLQSKFEEFINNKLNLIPVNHE